jgi:hypothetical protein
VETKPIWITEWNEAASARSQGQPVQLGEKKGIVSRKSKEQEARQRWTRREFFEVERTIAKEWRKSLA